MNQTAVDGDEAVRLYCQDSLFDIVLSDIEHLGMCAVDLQGAICATNPTQRFAFVTAYPIPRKRFTTEQLSQLIDEINPKSSGEIAH